MMAGFGRDCIRVKEGAAKPIVVPHGLRRYYGSDDPSLHHAL